ncbi:MAG: phage GP46 family protein [Desulfovibrionaceae bacterium]|nr:phage GP46 family protein [Desulfovibrionaceae bacterium]
MDISLAFDHELMAFDLVLAEDGGNRDLQGDAGLLAAVIVSLFTDRRAAPDDPLPDERVGVSSDRRGWWGDHILEEDARDLTGSRLWLLNREKDMDAVVERARQYAEEALAWIVRDRLATELRVNAFREAPGWLGIDIQALPLPGVDEKTREWNFVYDYVNAAPVSVRSGFGLAA